MSTRKPESVLVPTVAAGLMAAILYFGVWPGPYPVVQKDGRTFKVNRFTGNAWEWKDQKWVLFYDAPTQTWQRR